MPAQIEHLTNKIEWIHSKCHFFPSITTGPQIIYWSIPTCFFPGYDMATSGQSFRRPRSRNVKRTFVLLREDDRTRVPNSSTVRSLEQSGRVKELEFTNNATSEHISELLVNAFGNFLNNSNLNR